MMFIFTIKYCLLLLALIKKVVSENSVCIRDYQKVGCFLQSQFHQRDLLINDRVGTENVIDWQNYENYLHSLLCRCNQKAVEKNKLENKDYNYISIRFYGECYAGKEGLNGPQVSGCKNGKYKECVDTDIGECAGTSLVEYLYKIKRNGHYSTWSSFSSCSKSCDGGIEVRTRTCTNPAPLGDGKDCSEQGLDREERQCNTESCSGCTFKINDGVGAGEVHLGAVKNEAECIAKCYERQKVDPTINGVTTDLAGKNCYCEQGMRSQTGGSSWKSCYIPLRYRNGGYTEWSPFSTCSQSCNGGVETRTRTCTNPSPVGDGKDCQSIGPSKEERKCNEVFCDSGCVFKVNDGVGAGEVNMGAVRNENECIAKCYERQKVDPTINGVTTDLTGKSCYCEQGMKSQTGSSSWKSCFIPLRNRNGGYTEWSPFSTCSQSCDGGVEIRTRTCTNPTPIGDGKDCLIIGPDKEERKCNEVFCYSGCVFKTNDGVGAGEVHLGAVKNENECIAKCYERQKVDPTINGVTTDLAGKNCYCEQGMTSQTGGSSWKSCYIKRIS